jgi:hypothetical protein
MVRISARHSSGEDMAMHAVHGIDERKDFQVRLHMNNTGRFVRLPIERCNWAMLKFAAGALGLAVLLR